MTVGCPGWGRRTDTHRMHHGRCAVGSLFTALPESHGPGLWLFPSQSLHPVLSRLGALVLTLPSTVLVPLVLKDQLPCCPPNSLSSGRPSRLFPVSASLGTKGR